MHAAKNTGLASHVNCAAAAAAAGESDIISETPPAAGPAPTAHDHPPRPTEASSTQRCASSRLLRHPRRRLGVCVSQGMARAAYRLLVKQRRLICLVVWFFAQVAFRRSCGESSQNPSLGPITAPENVPTQAFSPGMTPRASPREFSSPPRSARSEKQRARGAARASTVIPAHDGEETARNDH